MIDNLSTAATLYLAPILSLTSFLLSLFAFLAPPIMLQDRIALLTVSPSSVLISPYQSASNSIDGPSLRLGLLGSCSRAHNSAPLQCTNASFSPVYDTSSLPDSSNPAVLGALPSTAPVAVLTSIVLSTLFFILFAIITMRGRLAWLGLLGFLVGMTAYLVLRMWFGKMVEDFNQNIIKQGDHGPKLIAEIGNAFTMAWVAFAFTTVPLICAMTKLHVTAAGGKA